MNESRRHQMTPTSGDSYQIDIWLESSDGETRRGSFLFVMPEITTTMDSLPLLDKAWLPDGCSQILRSYVFGPSGFWTMAPLRCAAKFDPFLSLDCASPRPPPWRNPRKGGDQILPSGNLVPTVTPTIPTQGCQMAIARF